MASISQFCSDCTFSNTDYSQFSYPLAAAAAAAGENNNCGDGTVSRGTISSGGGGSVSSCAISSCDAIWNPDEKFPICFGDGLPPESDVVSPSPMMSFPEHLGIHDSVVPTLAPEYNNMGLCGISGVQNFGARFPIAADVCEFGDDCCGFMHDLKPVYPAAAENWEIQNNQIMPAIEDAKINKVGRYSVEERKDRILRYLKKKNQRNFNKTIKYACRKTLADRRVRVRGRFARNNELCEEEMVMKNNENFQKDKELYCTADSIQIKQDEEWLQEAMANLMYLPYIAG